MSVTNHDDYLQYEADQAEHERQECARLFDEFWKPLVCNDNGSINQDKLNAELWDCHRMMMEVPKVYDHVTNGRLSKPNYPASVVIAEYDDQTTQFVDECVREETADLTSQLQDAQRERDEATERHKRELVICLRAMDKLEAERDQLAAEGRVLREGLVLLCSDLNSLRAESEGVAGLHLNGDIAVWDDLLEGGQLDDWLRSLNAAERLIASTPLTSAEVERVKRLEAVAEAAEARMEMWTAETYADLRAALAAWREAKP